MDNTEHIHLTLSHEQRATRNWGIRLYACPPSGAHRTYYNDTKKAPGRRRIALTPQPSLQRRGGERIELKGQASPPNPLSN